MGTAGKVRHESSCAGRCRGFMRFNDQSYKAQNNASLVKTNGRPFINYIMNKEFRLTDGTLAETAHCLIRFGWTICT